MSDVREILRAIKKAMTDEEAVKELQAALESQREVTEELQRQYIDALIIARKASADAVTSHHREEELKAAHACAELEHQRGVTTALQNQDLCAMIMARIAEEWAAASLCREKKLEEAIEAHVKASPVRQAIKAALREQFEKALETADLTVDELVALAGEVDQ